MIFAFFATAKLTLLIVCFDARLLYIRAFCLRSQMVHGMRVRMPMGISWNHRIRWYTNIYKDSNC